jgi:hypothetical protein
MILGYGIIAVPTGIVTEIAKVPKNKIVTDKNHVLAAAQKIIQSQFCPSLWIRLTLIVRKAIHCNSSSHRLYF